MKLDFILLNILINHVVLDEEESRLIQISLIGNEVRKTDNWFNEVYNESGKVGDYKGTPVYTIEEIKFEPKRANRNFIYALGHQGTSENLNLIFWDGRVNAAGSDVKENRPDYSFGKTAVEVETKGEEDWLVIKKEKKSKSTKVEEITLSAGIDRVSWLSQS